MRLLQIGLVHCNRCLRSFQYRRLHDKVESSGGDAGAWPRRVVTGIQPTGNLHIGNYFGALRRCVQMQDSGEDLMVFIADLHSLTTHQDASRLQENVTELTALLLASGLEPARCVLFRQSAVARHAELAWVLTCLASQARLAHLPQFRERLARRGAAGREAPLGALLYPVLQAADVLLYGATHVPVGADQLQHLQLAAQLARTFRHRYGAAFAAPAPLLTGDRIGGDRVRSLRDPAKKMSKSDPDGKASVLLRDTDDVVRLKFRKAVTDFTPRVTFEPESRPGVSNLVRIHCLAEDKEPEEVVEEAEHLTTAQYKQVVAEAVVRVLRPLRERADQLRARPALLRDVLAHGAVLARRRADETYERVARLIGVADVARVARAPHAAPSRQPHIR